MRPPIVHVTAAYGAGLWVGLVVSVPQPLGLAAAVVALAAGGVLGWPGIVGGAAGVGVLTGALAEARRQTSCAGVWPPGRHAAMVALHDRAGPRGLASATVVAAPERCAGELRLLVRPGVLVAGARAVVVGTFRAPSVLRVQHVRVLRGPRQVRFALRDALARRLERLYGARAPFVEALVLGRRDDLDPRWRRAFADAGLAHLLAISGLHVGIVAAWTLMLARLTLPASTAPLATAVAVWAYVTLLGFPPPAVRAATFITLYAAAKVRQRHPPPDAMLAAAVAVVLAADPLAATEVGAWLSVAATWGTGFALRQLPSARRGQPLLSLMVASLGATLATAPITAFAFGTVAPVGLLANLVAVPLTGVAVPGVLVSLIGGGPLAAGSGLPTAAQPGRAPPARRDPSPGRGVGRRHHPRAGRASGREAAPPLRAGRGPGGRHRAPHPARALGRGGWRSANAGRRCRAERGAAVSPPARGSVAGSSGRQSRRRRSPGRDSGLDRRADARPGGRAGSAVGDLAVPRVPESGG